MSDLEGRFHRNYNILKFFGIFLNDSPTPMKKWVSILRTSTSYVVHGFMVFQTFYDLYLVRADLAKLMHNVCMTGLTSGILLRNIMFLTIQSRLVSMHKKLLEEGHFTRDSETSMIFEDANFRIKRITNSFMVVVSLAMPSWLAIPFIGEEFSLMFRGWFPIDIRRYPHIYFAYALQFYYIVYVLTSILCCDMMTYNILLLIRAHFLILTSNIRKMDDILERSSSVKGENTELKNYIKNLVLHHHQIIRFVNEYDQLCRPILFLQVFGGTALIAGLLFEVLIFADEITSKMMAEGFVCSGTILNLFIYCWFGTVLESASFNISKAVYSVKWYSHGSSDSILRTFFILLIMHSQKPLRITAWKMAPVNFPTFLSMSEMIYNMIALFRQIANKF